MLVKDESVIRGATLLWVKPTLYGIRTYSRHLTRALRRSILSTYLYCFSPAPSAAH